MLAVSAKATSMVWVPGQASAYYSTDGGNTGAASHDGGDVSSDFTRSDDRAAAWVRLSDAQHQFGAVVTISGDARNYGRVYLGTGCRGVIVGDR